MKALTSVVLLIAASACAHQPRPRPEPAEARLEGGRGFGRLQVRYAPVDAIIAAQLRRALRVAIPLAERWGALPSALTITIHPTHEALESAARRPGNPWLRAWARRDRIEIESPRTWSHGAATDEQLVQLLAHELTHCVLDEAFGMDAHLARSVPAWFWEGMATTTAGERFPSAQPSVGAGVVLIANDAASPIRSPPLYAAADRAFRHLLATHGQERIRQVVSTVRYGVDFQVAFHEVLGIRLADFETELGLTESHPKSQHSASRG